MSGLDPDPHCDLHLFKIAIETLYLSVAVVQSMFRQHSYLAECKFGYTAQTRAS